MSDRLPVLVARLRMPLLWGGFAVLVLGLACYLRVGTARRPPVEVASPVAGRWLAVNSPADKVPSHGLHAYGQTCAIDLVHEPREGARPQFGQGPSFRRPEEFPALGQPVLARPTAWSCASTAASATTAAAAPGPACSTWSWRRACAS